jgi:hypothetical protein
MMKQSAPKNSGLSSAQNGGKDTSLSQLKALRIAQKEGNHRVEELKMRVFRITEQHMDQAVRLIKRWLSDNE